jgi:transcriptional regulator with XRE-family HTH domain
MLSIQSTRKGPIREAHRVARKNPVRKLERILIGRIKELTSEQSMPMSHLAGRAGIARSSLWAVMNGHTSPTLDWVQRIAEVLEVEPIELLTGQPVRLRKKR